MTTLSTRARTALVDLATGPKSRDEARDNYDVLAGLLASAVERGHKAEIRRAMNELRRNWL